MSRLIVTGPRGFIGRDLCRAALAHGHAVTGLARGPVPDIDVIAWQLGDPLPEACRDADAVIHLACATLVERQSLAQSAALDLTGTQRLLESVRHRRASGRRMRFVFLSSQSARPDAANMYGRSKAAIEALLMQDDEIVVRPGLVYDDAFGSVFGLFGRLARLPLVPIPTRERNIQPIHLRELTDCVLRIVETPRPERLYCLGSMVPLTFRDAIGAVARQSGRAAPLMLPVPGWAVRAASRLVDRVLRPTPPLTERIDGLISLRPMDTGPSLKALNRTLMPFDQPPRAGAA